MSKIMLTIHLIIILCIYHSNSAKILAVYPVPCLSHQLYFRTLTMELLKRGHNLTVLTTDPAFIKGTGPKNVREIDLHDLSYKFRNYVVSKMPMGNSDYLTTQMRVSFTAGCKMFHKQLKTDAVKKILENKNETFDLLLYDGTLMGSLIFSYIYKIPAISINSLGAIQGNYEDIGAFVNEAYYPSNMGSKTPKNQLERLHDMFNYYTNQILIRWYIERMQIEAVKNALGANMPELREMKKNMNMMFINLYSAWDSHRPVPISLKHMGGLHSVPEKPLPEDIKSYLDSSTHGVLYMSLGTNVRSSILAQDKVQIFVKVFSQLPYDVLWKWDFDTIPNKPKNVRLFKWLPQSDVLRHPKVKLFIMQGGLQSTDEALTAGVPLIGIPMFGDQWFNTEKYVKYNIGQQLDFEALTEESFRNSIERILGNQSYYNNIIQHRKLMHDQPRTPLYDAVHWIEYVIKHGGSHLQAPAADITWAEYVELELLIIIVTVLGSAIVSLCFGLSFVVRVSRS